MLHTNYQKKQSFKPTKAKKHTQPTTTWTVGANIYFIKCTKYKLQHDKVEAEFNLRINTHRKDIFKIYPISANCYFDQKDHIFNTRIKFIITEQLKKLEFEQGKHYRKTEKVWEILNKKTRKPQSKKAYPWTDITNIVLCITFAYIDFFTSFILTSKGSWWSAGKWSTT